MSSIRRICVVITARPSYSRVKTVLTAIKNHPRLELKIVVAASALLERYGSAVSVIEKDGFTVDAKVFNVFEGENLTSMAKTTGIGIIELATVFENIKPDIVVTIADRYETIATAVTASFMNIPLAHIQGGEITGSIDEKVRHAITKLSDYHFVSSEIAAKRVVSLGENAMFVFNTGCPSIDLAKEILGDSKVDFNPFGKYGGVGKDFNLSEQYLVVMQHPVTTEYALSRRQIEETLAAIQELSLPTFWFWPNVDAGSDGTSKGIRSFRENNTPPNIHFFKNLEPQDFLRLIYNAACLVGNSSVGIRESSFLGIPVVNIGTRQEGRDRGSNVIDVDYDKHEITRAVNHWLESPRPIPSSLYGNGDAGYRIANILAQVELIFSKKLNNN